MRRALTTLTAIAGLFLTACATTQPRPFAGDRISVVTRGSGPDLILIPGLAGHREEAWGGRAEELDDRYRLHLVQVNGFAGVAAGMNAEGPVAAPVAEELARYIREAGLERPAVMGHSLGGTVGMMLAARHPGLIGRLMVIDMMPYLGELFAPPGTTPEGLRAMADGIRARILESPPGGGMLGEMFQTMTLRAEMLPTLMRHLRESDRRTVANAFRELIVTDLRPELSRITAPVTVLYVQGPEVPLPQAQFDAALAGLYPNIRGARFVRFDGSRHFLHWDDPARFLAEVDAFMSR